VQVSAASHEVAEVLSALAVQSHNFDIQNSLLNWQFLPYPITKLLESRQDVLPLERI